MNVFNLQKSMALANADLTQTARKRLQPSDMVGGDFLPANRFDIRRYQLPTGKAYGQWTVTGPSYLRENGAIKYPMVPVVCSCGTTTNVNYHAMTGGSSFRCILCARKAVSATMRKSKSRA